MTDFETHPVGTAARIKQLEADLTRANAALIDAESRIPRFPDHMEQIVEGKNEGLPERISALVVAIQSIPDYMRQYQWQADDKQSFGSKWVRTIAGDNGKGMGRQAIAEVVSHIGVADYIAAANPDTVSLLIASLVKANAALAAAYEVAARLFDDGVSPTGKAAGDMIRALATPDQTAALDKLIAEAEARVWDEAVQIVADFPIGGDGPVGNDRVVWALENVRNAILAASKKGGV